jgi:thiol-disulfide isomerase/thioredoxin
MIQLENADSSNPTFAEEFMVHRHTRRAAGCIVVLLVVAVLTPNLRSQTPTTAPAAAPPSTAPASGARTPEQIMQDLQAAGAELGAIVTGPNVLTDEAQRKAAAPKAVPIIRKMFGYADEMAAMDNPQAKAAADGMRAQFGFLLVAFDDPEATAAMRSRAQVAGGEGTRAKAMLLLADWMHSSKDAAIQSKLVDDAEALVKSNPENRELSMVLQQLSQLPAASPDVSKKLQTVVAQVESSRPPKSLENKPLTLAGVKPDGQQFSTDQWKGKVILVDFWATWCGPCKEELPRVKKAYADFHDKGLEVLGVSCDQNVEELNEFLGQNKDMPWPQLFDAKNPGWHDLAKQYGIDGIPTMFLIDKKGVVRTVEARENFEELIPKLLAE